MRIYEEFEDTKGVIGINISKKNKQHNAWPKEKVQKDKQRSTKHTYKTKDRVTQTLLKTCKNIFFICERIYDENKARCKKLQNSKLLAKIRKNIEM